MRRLNLDNPVRPIACVDLNGAIRFRGDFDEALNEVDTFKAHWE